MGHLQEKTWVIKHESQVHIRTSTVNSAGDAVADLSAQIPYG